MANKSVKKSKRKKLCFALMFPLRKGKKADFFLRVINGKGFCSSAEEERYGEKKIKKSEKEGGGGKGMGKRKRERKTGAGNGIVGGKREKE